MTTRATDYDSLSPTPGRPATRSRPRAWLVVAVGASGVALSVLFYILLRGAEDRVAEARFELTSQARAEAFQQALADRLSAIDMLVAFYAGSEDVTRKEFHSFTQRLLNSAAFPDLRGLAWVQVVPAESRAEHEAAAQREGLTGYRITDRDARGAYVPAAARSRYFPVYFAEPQDRYRSLIGFDLGARENLATFLREAMQRQHEEQPLTVPTEAFFAAADETPVLCVAASVRNSGGDAADPSRPEPLNGIVLGEFSFQVFLHQTFDRLEHPDIDTYLFVETAGARQEEPAFVGSYLAKREDADEGHSAMPSVPDPASLQHAESITIGGRQWTVRCASAPTYLQQQRTWWPLGTLAAGVLLSGLLVGYLRLLSAHTAQVEREVAARTAELRTISNAALDAVVMTDPEGRVAHWNPAAERIFGYLREEILGRGVHETLVPAEDVPRAVRGLRVFAAGGRGPVVGRVLEMEALHKDGSRFPIEISVSPIELSGQWWAVAIVRDITRRKRAEEALQKEQRLLKEMLDLQERERKLVAYEIHDGLAQQLTGALYKFQAVDRLRESDPAEAEAVFAEGLRMLTDAMTETRRLIGGLRPLVLDESGIVAAIDYLIAEHQQRGGPEIEFNHKIRFQRLASPLESAVFRIVQESLTNACRYSRSARVRVEVTQLDDHVRVEVQDWGVGFDPQRINGGHYGLQGIRERARLFGGKATIDTVPGKGTHVSVELPLVEPPA